MARSQGGPSAPLQAGGDTAHGEAIRLDRWLCHARVFKTRTLAAARIEAGGVRVNSAPCRKPAHIVRAGDIVTAAVPGGVRVLRVLALGERRGPPAEAAALYDDLDPRRGDSR